jgi:hypothetical protein
MGQISRIGMDTWKHVFQLHGVNAAEASILRKSYDARCGYRLSYPNVMSMETAEPGN